VKRSASNRSPVVPAPSPAKGRGRRLRRALSHRKKAAPAPPGAAEAPASAAGCYDYALLLSPDGKVLAADEALPQRLGFTPEEFLGADVFALSLPDIAASRKKAVEQVLASGQALHYREIPRPGVAYDMRILPVFGPGRAVGALAVLVSDMSAEERAEKERHKLATAIEQTVEAVVITDLDFRIEYVNQAFETMSGYSRKEALGRALPSFYKGKPQLDKFERCAATIARGEPWTNRFLLVAKSGEASVCDQTISPVRAKFGRMLGYVFVWRDATRISELEKQVRHAQKMEAIGGLASGIAHDFNNILGPIILHAELCLSKLREDDPMQGSLPEILDAAKRAKALAQQLLYLGRGQENDAPIPFRLTSLLKECVKLLTPGLSPGILVRVSCEAASDLVLANPDHVHQVIMNLSTNAADAMRERGGVLTLAVGEVTVGDQDGRRYPNLNSGDYVRLSVSDTGHGMNSSLMERIFEPFFSTKTQSGGSGLGLSVVLNIVSRMRGSVDVESQPGQGSTFHVLLPKAPSLTPDLARPAPEPRAPSRSVRILLVDDEEAMAKGAAMALADLGYTVDCRASAAEGFAAFLESPDGYDLAMLDFVMPHLNGLELAGVLRRIRPCLPVILFSAYADKISSEEIFSAGINAFLAKPFDMRALHRAIGEVLGDGAGATPGERVT
jgi:PAS domain S-box-containing protein